MEKLPSDKIETQGKKTLNILDDFDATMDALSELEGKDWVKWQREMLGQELKDEDDEQKYNYRIRGALLFVQRSAKQLEELRQSLYKAKDEEEKKEEQYKLDRILRSTFEIYGNGGLHRYFVRPDGVIIYSGYNGPDAIESARKLGFKISGEE